MTGAGFFLLRPQDLPTIGELERSRAELSAAMAPVIGLPHAAPEALALAAVDDALRLLSLADSEFAVIADDPEESTGNRDNDRVFGIVRVDGDRPRILAGTALRGYRCVLDEALRRGTGLPPEDWAGLRVAFEELLRGYAGHVDVSRPAAPPMRPSVPPASAGDALRRWTRGHHVFMVLVQALVVAMRSFGEYLNGNDLDQAGDVLALATSLMWGCRAALVFTGDFPYAEYEKRVRPTLLPPAAPAAMSGLHWRDHEYLVRILAASRTTFANLDRRLEPQRGRLVEAIAAAYDAHRHVCQRFVGSEQPSVLMAARSHKPAVTVLDGLKRSRSAFVNPPPPR